MNSNLARGLTTVAAIVVIAAGVRFAQALIVPLLVGACIAAAAQPIAAALQARGWPRYAAGAATIASVLLVVVGFGTLIGIAAGQLSDSVPRLQAAIFEARDSVIASLDGRGASRVVSGLRRLDLSEDLAGAAAFVLSAVADMTGALFMILLVAIFILLEHSTLRPKLRRLVAGRKDAERRALQALEDVQRYLLLKTVMSAATGLIIGVWASVLGVEGAVLWGLVAFTFNYAPVIGSLIAAVPATMFAWADLGLVSALLLAGGFVVTNVTIGNIIEPRVMGRRLGLSPLVVLLSMAVWGFLLGPIGALVGVPITMVVKIACRHSDRFGWVAVVLASGRKLESTEAPIRSDEVRRSGAASHTSADGRDGQPGTSPAFPMSHEGYIQDRHQGHSRAGETKHGEGSRDRSVRSRS